MKRILRPIVAIGVLICFVHDRTVAQGDDCWMTYCEAHVQPVQSMYKTKHEAEDAAKKHDASYHGGQSTAKVTYLGGAGCD